MTALRLSPSDYIPPSGPTAGLAVVAAAAMGFLAAITLFLAAFAGTMARDWTTSLDGTATIIADPATSPEQVTALLAELAAHPGVTSATPLDVAAQAELLAPWLGANLPTGDLPFPLMIAVTSEGDAPDWQGLAVRAQAVVPSARLDSHDRWRDPLIAAARRLQLLAKASVLVVAGGLVFVVMLAVRASLAANQPVIRTLRLIGATDRAIARAFVRRFTLRAVAGAALGVLLAACALALFVTGALADSTTLPPWRNLLIWFALVPLLSGVAAWLASRLAAFSALRKEL